MNEEEAIKALNIAIEKTQAEIKSYKELEYKYNKALSDLVQAEHKNKELEEENKTIKGNYYTLCADIQMVTTELGFPEDTIIADEMVSMIKENYIPVSLVEEKRTKLKEQYNKVVNEINNQGMIDQLIDFKEVSAKLEMCEELLEKRK